MIFREIFMINYRRPLAERARDRKFGGPYRWRPTAPNSGRGFYQSTARGGICMDSAGSSFALRLEDANAHYRPHRGPEAYGADDYGDAIYAPIIARLPHGRGFLAGWTLGRGMAASLEPEIYQYDWEAAQVAHSVAETAADREIEYRAREDAEREAEEAAEDEDEEDE